MAASLLTLHARQEDKALLATLQRGTSRMTELVKNIMDFARTRMGEGIILTKTLADPKEFLTQVVAELQLIYPARTILTEFSTEEKISADAGRLSQLVSNLAGNALTHGKESAPVIIKAFIQDAVFYIDVCNEGKAIPDQLRERLFAPFTRDVAHASINGLGLGLYIASEIAKAHAGELSFTSTDAETCFSFKMAAE